MILESKQLINVSLIRFWRKKFYRHIDSFKQYDKLSKLMIKINHIICSHCHLIDDIKKTQSQNSLKCFEEFSSIDNDTSKLDSVPSEPSSSKNIFGLFQSTKEDITPVIPKATSQKTDKDKLNRGTEQASPFILKKSSTGLITYSQYIPSFDIENEGENANVVYKSSSSEVKLITLDLLLKKIACEGYYSSNEDLMNSFINQLSCFISVTTLIQKMILAFIQLNKKVTADFFIFLKLIISEKYHSDIKGDLDLTERINNFFLNIELFNIKDKRIISLINESKTLMSSLHINNSLHPIQKALQIDRRDKPPSNLPSPNKPLAYFDIFEHKEIDIALQITNITNALINNIDPNEFLITADNREVNGPNLFKLIQRSNKLTLFVLEDICSYDYKKTRTKVIEKYIRIASELKKLNNFNDLLVIVSAMSHMIVQTFLAETWLRVGQDSKTVLAELNHFVSFEELYKNIRKEKERLLCEHIAFTPYVGITLKKLSFLEESHQYIQNKRLINFEKISLVEQVISEFLSYRKCIKPINLNNKLCLLDKVNPKSEKELIILAKLLEPSFCLMKRKSSKKRMTQTESTFAS